ncbi:hypothetical protein [Halobacillus seohaensis]|uniref:Uncharacterized protein n=1 Tax=Halobacillus seohaensis TaxID=447421 RepID=A0ABW2ENZ7_9BACI
MFDDEPIEIPKTVLSPIEVYQEIDSAKYVGNQKLFAKYVKDIQRQHGCSWFEARKKFFEIKTNKKTEAEAPVT